MPRLHCMVSVSCRENLRRVCLLGASAMASASRGDGASTSRAVALACPSAQQWQLHLSPVYFMASSAFTATVPRRVVCELWVGLCEPETAATAAINPFFAGGGDKEHCSRPSPLATQTREECLAFSLAKTRPGEQRLPHQPPSSLCTRLRRRQQPPSTLQLEAPRKLPQVDWA